MFSLKKSLGELAKNMEPQAFTELGYRVGLEICFQLFLNKHPWRFFLLESVGKYNLIRGGGLLGEKPGSLAKVRAG